MTLDPLYNRLVEMTVELKNEAAREWNPDGRSCTICHDQELELGIIETVSGIEYHAVFCPTGCGGALCFSQLYIIVDGPTKQSNVDFAGISCSSPDCEPENPNLENIAMNSDPEAVDEFQIPIPQIIQTKIHEHHTSYEDDETIPVCAGCHRKIHTDDAFRPDLRPETSWKEWESDIQ